MVKIYICNAVKNICTENFSSYRLLKLKRITDEVHYAEALSAEALLCCAAKKEGLSLPLDIKVKEGGKPFAENFNFSISHSKGKILVAVSDCEVGADIQKINPLQSLGTARKFLTEKERANLDTEKFFKLFTMKESYFKMTGEGLPLSPVPFENFTNCYFHTFKKEDYMISVCSPEPFETVIEYVTL